MVKRREAGNVVDLGGGKYRLRYRGQSKNITATSPRDLNKQLSAFVSEVDKGQVQCKFTFKEFSEKWLKEYAKSALEVKTAFRYKEILEGYVYDEIGYKKLENITGLDLTSFYNKLRATGGKRGKGLSQNTVQLFHKVISAVFKTAIEWKIFRDISPCTGIKFQKQKKQTKLKFYTEPQIKQVYKALEDEDLSLRVAIVLTFDTGLRVGEIGGLTWKDINFNNNTINVDKVTQYINDGKGTREKDSTKSESGIRKIGVPKSTMSLLAEYKKSQQDKGFLCSDGMHVFVNAKGEAKYTYWLSVEFPKFLGRHGLPHLNYHGIRHSHASLLIEKGCNLKYAADRLGHADTLTLQTIYLHADVKNDDIATGILEQLHETAEI